MSDYDYRLSHQPFADGDELWNLSATGTFPADVYQHPEWYSFGEWTDVCAAVIRAVRGKPDAMVLVYRAVPPGVLTFNSGDWVTTNLGYARQHAARTADPAEDWPVIVARVRADMVRSGGSDIVEWGYFGASVAGVVVPVGVGDG
jgi:hypothetical protein